MLRLARTTRRACVDTKEVHASGFFGECWRRRRGVDAPVSQFAHVCGRSPVSGVAGSHRAVATSAGVAAGASVGSARTCLCLSSHPLEVLQHAVDTRQIAVVLAQSVERNTGAPVGTVSGPIEFLELISQGIATDELFEPDWSNDRYHDGGTAEEEAQEVQQEPEEEQEEAQEEEAQEDDGALGHMPETVTKTELNFLLRKSRRNNDEEPRMTMNLIKMLYWLLMIRRLEMKVTGFGVF